MVDRNEVEWIFSERRREAEREAERREAALREADPQFAEIRASIQEAGRALLFARLHGKSGDAEEETLAQLHAALQERLQVHGITERMLQPPWTCAVCEDTGTLEDGSDCDCKRRLILELDSKEDPGFHRLEHENFSRFDLTRFRDAKRGQEPTSPRENMEELYHVAQEFVRDFGTGPPRNLLFYGPVGTGKSFLCHSIAQALLERGRPVVYRTAYQLTELFQSVRFATSQDRAAREAPLERVKDADLLVIDDFGTENINTMTVTWWFELLNDRMLLSRSTILSTNLELEEIKRAYSERIFSRLFAHYELYPVYGDDLRLKL